MPNARLYLLPEADAAAERTLEAVRCSARLCQKSIFRKCGLTKSMGCKAHMLQKQGFDTVCCVVRQGPVSLTSSPVCPVRLLDHLVRLEEERRGHEQTECLGGLQVDHELELHRLLDRKVRRLRPLEDLVHIDGSASDDVKLVWSVGHEAAGLHIRPCVVHGRQV